MLRISALLLLTTLSSAMLSLCPERGQGSTPWRSLFNGRDLAGWQHLGPGSFQIVDGQLVSNGGMGLLWYTREQFRHARIKVVFKLGGKGADSGLFIRVPEQPREVWMPINKGYEVEIGDWPDDYSCTGVIYSFSKAISRPIKPFGEWNEMEVSLEGPRTIVVLNGVKVTDYREGDAVPPRKPVGGEPAAGPRGDSGYIGLQNHPGPPVYFRQISVQQLP